MCICPHQINFMPWLCECTCLLIWGGLLWILIAYSFTLVVLWTGVLFVHDDKSETTLIKDYIYIELGNDVFSFGGHNGNHLDNELKYIWLKSRRVRHDFVCGLLDIIVVFCNSSYMELSPVLMVLTRLPLVPHMRQWMGPVLGFIGVEWRIYVLVT